MNEVHSREHPWSSQLLLGGPSVLQEVPLISKSESFQQDATPGRDPRRKVLPAGPITVHAIINLYFFKKIEFPLIHFRFTISR